MAHKIRVVAVPHRNADGKLSKTKMDYMVVDKTRRKTILVGTYASEKTAEEAAETHRAAVVHQHHVHNPRDEHFQQKHGIGANNV